MDLDAINRRTWETRTVLRQYRNLEGYVDPGECAAITYLADECRDQPVLDIGVGCGRTTPLLRLISSDYMGVDYTRKLLEVAAQKNPQVRYQFMDAPTCVTSRMALFIS